MSILIYLATIFWSLFPNLIHVFQGGEDFINKVNENNLVVNGDFSQPNTFWSKTPSSNTMTEIVNITDKVYLYTTGSFVQIARNNLLTINDQYYLAFDLVVISGHVVSDGLVGVVSNTSGFNSFVSISNLSYLSLKRNSASITTELYIDNIYLYNVSQMKINGVKNDDGIAFADLTNEQIKSQLDIWITEHGDLSFTITKDNTHDSWFNSGFVEKTAERDFLDYLGYFVWLMTPPIILFITLDMIRRLI